MQNPIDVQIKELGLAITKIDVQCQLYIGGTLKIEIDDPYQITALTAILREFLNSERKTMDNLSS